MADANQPPKGESTPQQIEVQPIHAGSGAELRELQAVLTSAGIRSVAMPPPGSKPGKG